MEDINVYTLLLLVCFGFLASFIDSVVGGGGLISIPALLFSGLPPSVAIATNKLASSMGSLTSTIAFIRSGKVDFHLVAKLFPLVFTGSLLGAWVVNFVSTELLKPLVLVLLIAVAIYTILKKTWGHESTYRKLTWKKALLFSFVIFAIGFYDGFLGAGTGSFILFAFLIIGFDFLQSAGNAKFLNFGSNIAALIMFISLDMVNFSYGIPMGISMILGALVGSNFAIKKGVTYVRVLFIFVTVLLIGKNIVDYIRIM
ncbi:TSUP family transporter [Bacillus sp. Xin]|uniref:TSUP family transporter n=1 Tax=unclassified Bacillus (in: firmicutes) TaxID=185979 RepID=UPI001574902A|nr:MULTISPECIES: TSUP family transporter [unclassified Bacillus (in: firmicutes)]MBC6975066.1 TSUP family transporter [Bacillus sp. Xin]NSW39471.1 TSUP family transporter [Bacillus sp. Xin1]